MLNAMQLANNAWAGATGYATRAYEMVRQWSKEHRRDQPSRPRNLRRINLPIARPALTPSTFSPPTSSQPMEELSSDRKRKPDELLSSMSRVKRRDHGYNKSSPWSENTWAQQLTTNIEIKSQNAGNTHYKKWNRRKLPRKQYTLHGIRYQRSPSPKIMKPYRVSLVPHRPDHFEQAYHDLSQSNTPEKSHTPGRTYTPERFLTPDGYRSDEEESDAQEDPLHLDIDDDVLQATKFAFVQPPEKHDILGDDKTEPIEELAGEEDAEDEESDWDEEGELDHRKMLRGMAESYDEEGFRVPIDGIISPESQEWNEDHRKKLHERAALEQQTPSKPPKYSTPTPPFTSPQLGTSPQPVSPDPIALDNTVLAGQENPEEDPIASLKTVPKTEASISKVEETEELQTPPTSPRTTYSTPQVAINGDVSAVKSEDTEEVKVLQTPSNPIVNGTHVVIKTEGPHIKADDTEEIKVAQAPATADQLPTEFENLHLSKLRTPKSEKFDKDKAARNTRLQKLLAEIAEAKNAYPLVPLSKTWDDKVRHAVNHGHGRFEAKMFNKCVPEYSSDPAARSLWLDDAVINDYVAMVAKHGSKGDRKDQVRSVAALSSFFFTKISASNVNYSSCAGMLKRAGIPGKKLLDCEKIFIPINRSYHWTIAVIEPKIPEGLTAADHARKVTVYNSMGSSGGHAVAEIIMRWLRNDLGASFKEDEWVIDPAGASPQQRNTDDCGVFTCTTARQIMLRKYDDVKQRYKEGDIRDMRKRIVAELVNGDLLNKEESKK